MRTLTTIFSVLCGLLSTAPLARAQWNYGPQAAIDGQALFGGNGGLGHAVDLDGDTAVVGVPYPFGGSQGGHVLVYRRVAGAWSLEADLVGTTPATSGYLGYSVAIDGDRIVAGAPFSYDTNGQNAATGTIYVYTRTGSNWSSGVQLYASDPQPGAQLGWSVAISGDTIAAGAQEATFASQGGRGAVYMFDYVGGNWVETAKLAGTGTTFGARNGSSVALEGDTMVEGARTTHEDNGTTIGTGSAYVFRRNGGIWTQEAKLQATNYVAGAALGSSAALDGNRIVLGAEGENFNRGAAYVFEFNGATWPQAARLQGAGTDASDYFGRGVDIDGDFVVVGAPNYDSSTPMGLGAVKLFQREGSVWSEKLELVGTQMTTGDTLGDAAAIQGSTIVGGSPSLVFNQPGKAWIWSWSDTTSVYCSAKLNSLGCLPQITWDGTPSATSSAPFWVGAYNVLSQQWGVLFYGFAPQSVPFQDGTLCVLAPLIRLPIQFSAGNAQNDCSGHYFADFNARIQSGIDPALVPGVDVHCQYWTRDPQSASTTGLTNALQFKIQN